MLVKKVEVRCLQADWRPAAARAIRGAALLMVLGCDALALRHVPTLDDAFALRSVGQIALSPKGLLLAVEREGYIRVWETSGQYAEAVSLRGWGPKWSPDGLKLAFWGTDQRRPQLRVWIPETGTHLAISDFPGGVSPGRGQDGNTWKIAWAPDSNRIAFASRRMPGYELFAPSNQGTVRVFDGHSPWPAVYDGIYGGGSAWKLRATSGDEIRNKALAEVPQFRVSHLFVADINSISVRQLTHSGNFHSPEWSADGTNVLAISDSAEGYASLFPMPGAGNLSNRLTAIEVATGAIRLVETPERFLGAASVSPGDGKVALLGKSRRHGFRRVLVRSPGAQQWETIQFPQPMSAMDLRWSSSGARLQVLAADRTQNTVWELDWESRAAKRKNCGDAIIRSWEISEDGVLYFVGDGPNFKSRVFKCSPTGGAGKIDIIFDPNPQLADVVLGEQRIVSWRGADGDVVEGIVILPPGYEDGRSYPVIVDVYPGWPRNALRLSSLVQSLGQLHAAWGYIVFLPTPRSPSAFAFTRDETHTEKGQGARAIPYLIGDVTTGIQHLARLGIADPQRVALFGHSLGGWNLNLLITRTTLARCAVISNGISDLMLWPAYDPDDMTGTTLYSDPKAYVELSPMSRMNRVEIPLLMLMGDHDYSFAPHMLAQFNALSALGAGDRVKLVRYTEEAHGLSKRENMNDALDRMRSFYSQCLQ